MQEAPPPEEDERSRIERVLAFVFQDYSPGTLDDEEILALSSLLRPRSPSRRQRLIRLLFQAYSDHLPTSWRLSALRLLRRFRNTRARDLTPTEDCRFNRLVRELTGRGLKLRGYQGKRFALCLSYDLDQQICMQSLGMVIESLAQRGLTATFHVLTNWEYEVDWARLQDARDQGFEIGMHGGRHDIALGYRSHHAIEGEILAARDQFPFEVSSYRAPALCMTDNLMAIIESAGFRCDSSLPMANRYYHQVESCFPFPCGSGPIWELPVTLQDSTLFLDQGLSVSEAFEETLNTIRPVRELGGVSVLNLHPYAFAAQEPYHPRLLDAIASLDDCWVCTHSQVVEHTSALADEPRDGTQ